MPQSLSKNYIHLTFSTKYRKDSINEDKLSEISKYISGILKNIDCPPIIVGGFTNHIHILCILNKNIALSKMVEEVKRSSSKWIKSLGPSYHDFSWPGIGPYFVKAIQSLDYPIVMNILVLSGTLVILGNLLSDILYCLTDPRIKSMK